MFAAAIVPGIMLASFYAAYALIRCWMNPSLGPTLSEEDQPQTSHLYWLEAILVIGSILMLFTLLMVMGLSGGLAGLFPFSSLLLPAGWAGADVCRFCLGQDQQAGRLFLLICGMNFSWVWSPPSALVAFALGSILFGWATRPKGRSLRGVWCACLVFGLSPADLVKAV